MLRRRFFCLSVVFCVFLMLCSWSFAATGDARRGESLFVGSTSFVNGGAPCLACHNLVGFGMSSGANYGPDLSSLYESYGREGVEGVLLTLSFPSMEAIYADRPLSAAEVADMLTFLEQTSKLSVVPDNGTLILQVCIGVVLLVGLTLLIGLRRMRAVRQPLIDRQRTLINKGEL